MTAGEFSMSLIAAAVIAFGFRGEWKLVAGPKEGGMLSINRCTAETCDLAFDTFGYDPKDPKRSGHCGAGNIKKLTNERRPEDVTLAIKGKVATGQLPS